MIYPLNLIYQIPSKRITYRLLFLILGSNSYKRKNKIYTIFRLFQIKLGTFENEKASDTEWSLRPYMNTARKRRFLSDEDGWLVQD